MVIRTRLCVRVHITMLTGNEGMGPTSCCCLLLLQAQQLGPTTTTATTMLRETANLTRPAVCVCVWWRRALGAVWTAHQHCPNTSSDFPLCPCYQLHTVYKILKRVVFYLKIKIGFAHHQKKTIHYFNNRRVKQRNGQIRLKLFKMKKRDVSRVPRRGTSSK